jgi:hypothetical protein
MAKHSQSTTSSSTPPDPRKWEAAEEPITPAQRSELERLTRAAGEDFDPEASLTKAEAELEIEELRRAAKRGESGGTVQD